MDSQTQKKLLNIVKDNYDKIAPEFNNTRKRYHEPLWSGLISISKNIKRGDKILDAGCGNGRLLKIIGEKEIKYLGIDSNKKLLDIARETNQTEYKIKNAEFRMGDILELGKVPEINFDYVFSVAVLHHFPGRNLQIKALRQLKNKVGKNGKIIITVWNLWNNDSKRGFKKLIIKFSILKLLKKNKMDWGDVIFTGFNVKSKRYYHAFTKRGLRKIIKKSRLKIEKLYKDKYNYYAILKK